MTEESVPSRWRIRRPRAVLTRTRPRLLATVGVLVLVWGIVGMVVLLGHRAQEREIRENARSLAGLLASQLDARLFKGIEGPRDVNTSNFWQVAGLFQTAKLRYPDATYIYTLRPSADGPWRFVVDAQPTNVDLNGDGVIQKNEEGVLPGTPYDAVTPELEAALLEAVVTSSYQSDDWGTYISGFAPVFDPLTGETEVVLGVDFSRERTSQKALLLTLAGVAAALLLSGLSVATLRAYFSKADALETIHRLSRHLAEQHEELHRMHAELRERDEHLRRDLELAREVQATFLPREVPGNHHLRVASFYRACGEVGGDLFDLFELGPGRVGFYIADASGHGVTAALITAVLKSSIDRHRGVLGGCDPGNGTGRSVCNEFLHRVNSVTTEAMRSGSFITLQLGILDLGSGDLLLVNAGHNAPVLCGHGGGPRVLEVPANVAIGIIEQYDYEIVQGRLLPGEKLVLYTDGLTERHNAEDRELGLEGLMELIGAAGSEGAPGLVDGLMTGVNAFGGGIDAHDDEALLVIEYLAAGGGPETA